MITESLVVKVLKPLGIEIAYGTYTGTKDTYISFTVHRSPSDYADNIPHYDSCRIYVDLFAPATINITAVRKRLRRLLFEAGFDYPDETPVITSNTSSDGRQHYNYSCEFEEYIDYTESLF